MADKTIDSELFVLVDNWPGVPRMLGGGEIPTGGFTGSTHHNVATAGYGKGEKVCVWNPSSAGLEGQSTFIYLQVGTQNGAVALAAKAFCVTDSATDPFVITNDPDDCIGPKEGCALVCIALSALTDAYYGWFWCGGVCPEYYVTALGGNYGTESNVVAGACCVHDLTADALGLGPVAADTEVIIAYAIAADAA